VALLEDATLLELSVITSFGSDITVFALLESDSSSVSRDNMEDSRVVTASSCR